MLPAATGSARPWLASGGGEAAAQLSSWAAHLPQCHALRVIFFFFPWTGTFRA